MKKKYRLLFVLLVCLLQIVLFSDDVYARYDDQFSQNEHEGVGQNLSNENYTLECIYSEGSLFTLEYSTGKGSHYTNKTIYPLTGTAGNESSDRTILYANDMYERDNCSDADAAELWTCILQNKIPPKEILTCQPNIWKSTLEDITYYKFGGEKEIFSCDPESDDYSWEDCLVTNPGLDMMITICAESPSYCYTDDVDSELYNIMMKTLESTSTEYMLVSERYILSSEYDEPNNVFYYVIPSEQAAGNDSYIKIMTYENVVLLEKEGRVTRLKDDVYARKFQEVADGVVPYETIYLNSPEPMPSTTSSSTTSYSFKTGQTKYSISNTKDSTHTKKYTYTSDIPDGSTTDDSLCTQRLKNTSPILKNIIKYSQILIPAIVLIITGIDVGKIVVAGNFEEEMPKRKKLIITRLIVMVVFFFLPLFVRLIISLVKESGIGENKTISNGILYIDCLFDPDAEAGVDDN